MVVVLTTQQTGSVRGTLWLIASPSSPPLTNIWNEQRGLEHLPPFSLTEISGYSRGSRQEAAQGWSLWRRKPWFGCLRTIPLLEIDACGGHSALWTSPWRYRRLCRKCQVCLPSDCFCPSVKRDRSRKWGKQGQFIRIRSLCELCFWMCLWGYLWRRTAAQ